MRIARSIIWRVTGDEHRATRLTGRLGQGITQWHHTLRQLAP